MEFCDPPPQTPTPADPPPQTPTVDLEEERRAERERTMEAAIEVGEAHLRSDQLNAALSAFKEALANCDSEVRCAHVRERLDFAERRLGYRARQQEYERMADAVKEYLRQDLNRLLSESGSSTLDTILTPGGDSGALTIEEAFPGSSASGPLEFSLVEPSRPPLFKKGTKQSAPVDVRDLEVATGEAFKQGQDLRDYVDKADWPISVKSKFVLGIVMAERGRYEDAFNYFLEAAHAAPYDGAHGTPYDPVIRDALQEAMRLSSQRAEAAADAGHLAQEVVDPDRLAHLPPKARAGVMVAAASVSVGDYDAAVRLLGEAAEAAPGDQGIAEALIYVRSLKAARDERTAGPKEPRRYAAAIARRKGEAAWQLGMYLAENGDYDGAVRYLREAQGGLPDALDRDLIDESIARVRSQPRMPGLPVYRSKAHAVLDALQYGALEYGKGDWDASLRYVEAAHTADPDDLAVRDALNYLQGLYPTSQ